MRKILYLLIISLFFTSCATYYKSYTGKQFLPNLQDTLVFTWKITTDTSWYIIKQLQYEQNDTIVSISFFPDSTFFDYQFYTVDEKGMQLLSEFYAFNMAMMFWKVDKGLTFGTNPRKVGEIKIDKWLEAGGLIQKIRIHSLRSMMDTISLGDSTFKALRVDVRTRMWQKNPPVREKSLMSYYFYPGLGLIYVRGQNNYSEEVLFIEKK